MDKVASVVADAAVIATNDHDQWWQYGAIGVICVVFALTIRYLYSRKEAREDAIAVERTGWAEERAGFATQRERDRAAFEVERAGFGTQRERDRAAFEVEFHKIADKYAQSLREDREGSHEREDQIRKEFGDLMEQIATEIGKMSAELTRVLDKIHERFLGPRPRY